MAALARELYSRDKLLTLTGLLHVVLLAACFALFFFDDRTILGINPWIKPAKFCISITIFLWTVAWLMPYAHAPRWLKWIISGGLSIAMIVEIVCIGMQSARGTTSHYNFATAFDAAVFSTMGNMIALNTVLMFVLMFIFFRRNPELPRSYLWGIRFGFILFLFGSAEAGLMISNNAHTVGAEDGVTGLPFVNWSTEYGDLRIAHFALLHGLQVMPLFGWAVHTFKIPKGTTAQVMATMVLFLLYAAAGAFVLVQALRGQPLLPL